MNKPMVTYKCEDCGAGFDVEQGSRRRFCAKCMADKITGRPPKEQPCEKPAES